MRKETHLKRRAEREAKSYILAKYLDEYSKFFNIRLRQLKETDKNSKANKK